MSAALAIVFTGPSTAFGAPYQMTTRFNDSTAFLWDCTKPISNSIWTGKFGDNTRVLPSTYLNLVVMNNLASYQWTWPSITQQVTTTFTMPVGNITLQTMMNNIYTGSQQSISPSQYQDITGQTPDGPGNVTVASALNFNAMSNQYNEQLLSITQEAPTVLRVNC